MADRQRSLLVPTLAAVFFLGVTLAAGDWQLHRAQYKRDLQAQADRMAQAAPVPLPDHAVDPESFRNRRVVVTGIFDPEHEIFIDNKTVNGRTGYQVLTPMKVADSAIYVLVDRGWIAGGPDRRILPNPKEPRGVVRVEGIAAPPSGRFLELSDQIVQGKVWQNLHLDRYAKTVPYALQPVVVTQLNDTGDGLYRHWTRPDFGIEMHEGYAFQWFALAATIVVLYVVLYAKRKRNTKI